MSRLRKFATSLRSLIRGDRNAEFPAFLGNLAGTVKADQGGNVYVTLLNGEVRTVYNEKVPNVPRLPVVIGYGGTDKMHILRSRDVFPSAPYPDVPNHAFMHTFPGPDTVPVRAEQFLPGLVTPKTGLTVRIYSLPYELADGWHVLATQDLDLTSSVPSSGAKYARLEADDTGAVTISLGTAVDARSELEYSDIPDADPDKFSLAAVKLYAGQTSLIFLPTDTDIIDLRFGRMSGGSGGGSFDLADAIHTATSDSSFHDDDEFPKSDSQDSWGLKKFTWANAKAALKTYFDTLYATIVTNRELLTANRTYYVRTDGSDSNNGLANTSGGAFLTIQKAVDVVAALDLSTYNVTIQVGNGTYTGAVTLKTLVGAGTVTIQGDTTTPANVIISTTSANCFTAQNINGLYLIQGFELRTTTSGSGLFVQNSYVQFGVMNFGACATAHITLDADAYVSSLGTYTINGASPYHWNVLASILNINNGTITISGTPAFSSYFASCTRLAYVRCNGSAFSGSATGTRYLVNANGVLFTNGGGASFLPGNAAGSTATGGQYI